MMCGCSSQVATLDMSAAILDNSFKMSTPLKKLSKRFIDNSINEWRRRLEAVIKNGCIIAVVFVLLGNTVTQ